MSQDLALQAVAATGGRFIGFDTTTKHDGLRALIYRFIKFFLTPIGSDPANLEYGTEFGKIIASPVDPTTLQAIVLQSIDYTVEKLREYDAQREEDNALRNAVLQRLEVDSSGASATIYIEITNVANQSLIVYVTTGAANG